jgi:hypothetical protein
MEGAGGAREGESERKNRAMGSGIRECVGVLHVGGANPADMSFAIAYHRVGGRRLWVF